MPKIKEIAQIKPSIKEVKENGAEVKSKKPEKILRRNLEEQFSFDVSSNKFRPIDFQQEKAQAPKQQQIAPTPAREIQKDQKPLYSVSPQQTAQEQRSYRERASMTLSPNSQISQRVLPKGATISHNLPGSQQTQGSAAFSEEVQEKKYQESHTKERRYPWQR